MTGGQTPLPPEVAESFARDPERWTLSYTQHTATALRRRQQLASEGAAWDPLRDPHPYLRT